MAVRDFIIGMLCIFVLFSFKPTDSANEHCFTFRGNSYLVFSPGEPFDNSNSAHFELEFKTSSLNGVLMYSRGASSGATSGDADIEALYIRGGNLHYHLFNPGRGGVGRHFGGHFVSQENVDLNTWIKVHVYRSYRVASRTAHSRNSVWKTGIEFELNGRLREYTDTEPRQELDLALPIYIGGYSSRLSDTVGNFTGQIRGIKERRNQFSFEDPSLNYKSQVDLQCIEFATPQ